MKVPLRTLAKDQCCQACHHAVTQGENGLIVKTTDLLLEAPNWALQGDAPTVG